MRLVIRWTKPPAQAPRPNRASRKALLNRQERLREVMLLALRTPAGRDHPDQRQLELQVRQHTRPEHLLDGFPVISRELYRTQRERFLNPDCADTGFQRFQYPLEPLPRIAILMEGFLESEKVMCSPEGWSKDLEHFRPEALAGPVSMLRRMATTVFNRGARFPSLKRPIVAFTGLPFGDTGILTDTDRDQLWQAFNLPVYEYFLGHRHEVLARECDARMGLHVDAAQAIFEVLDPVEPATGDERRGELVVTSLANSLFPIVRLASGLRGTLTRVPCSCGATGERLLHLEAHVGAAIKPRVRAAVVGQPPSGTV